MLILMLPGMITGSSLSAIISCGTIVAPIMLKMGIPKQKVGAIIAFGAILGMVAPPINIPVMVICDVVDIPYTGFDVPLMLLTFPMAVIVTLFLSRSFSFKKQENAEPVKRNWLENGLVLGVLAIAYIALLVLFITSKEEKLIKLYGAYLVIFAVVLAIAAAIVLIGKPYNPSISKEHAILILLTLPC